MLDKNCFVFVCLFLHLFGIVRINKTLIATVNNTAPAVDVKTIEIRLKSIKYP